jgi:hypothetical protein
VLPIFKGTLVPFVPSAWLVISLSPSIQDQWLVAWWTQARKNIHKEEW